jgi:hypothetical protein
VKPQCVPAGMASPADRDRGFSISRRGWQSTGGRHRPAESTGPDSPGGGRSSSQRGSPGGTREPVPPDQGVFPALARDCSWCPTFSRAGLSPEPVRPRSLPGRGAGRSQRHFATDPENQRNAMLETHSLSSRRTVRDSPGCGASGGWRATARTFAARRCRGPPAGLESRM